ncbi:hypothetical protein [Croceiramulus getboli]|nr:hypothetical protein P8624_06165 [Flavobacteriaceae bacterium YJPT1-3]
MIKSLRIFPVLVFLALSPTFLAQTHDFTGVIKLNDSAFIPYKLVFDINDEGQISGFSLTDFAGKHETKSNLRGAYNAEENMLRFQEYDIVYTKSPVVETDFCFVQFEGLVKNLERAKAMSGLFNGYYANDQPCLDGEVTMTKTSVIQDRVRRMDKRIQRSNKFSAAVKRKVSAKRILDTLTRNTIEANETLNVFTADEAVDLIVYDAGKIDQDRITITVNGEALLTDFETTAEQKVMRIPLEKEQTIIQILALNEGSSPPNTAKIEVRDSQNYVQTITNLKKGESATLTVIRKK